MILYLTRSRPGSSDRILLVTWLAQINISISEIHSPALVFLNCFQSYCTIFYCMIALMILNNYFSWLVQSKRNIPPRTLFMIHLIVLTILDHFPALLATFFLHLNHHLMVILRICPKYFSTIYTTISCSRFKSFDRNIPSQGKQTNINRQKPQI